MGQGFFLLLPLLHLAQATNYDDYEYYDQEQGNNSPVHHRAADAGGQQRRCYQAALQSRSVDFESVCPAVEEGLRHHRSGRTNDYKR